MKENFLKVEDLEVVYKSGNEVVHAVNHIDFEISSGETLGIVGETGAGKTTTALTILRLLPERTSRILNGKIMMEGRDLLTIEEAEMRKVRGADIAMIFQDPMTSLNPVLTVGDQIAEALELHNTENRSKEEIQDRVEEVLRMVGIPAVRKNDYPHQFSGGMKQRVVIAIALACEPHLLIADEPTTALDVTIQAQVLLMIKELRDRINMPMILITHDLGVVAQTCDRVAVMYAGEIIEYGTLEDIFTGDNHHPYTVGLFGSIPKINDKRPRLEPIPGMMPDPTKLPEGCYFADRCPHCTEKCRKEHPKKVVNGSHMIFCHKYEKGENNG